MTDRDARLMLLEQLEAGLQQPSPAATGESDAIGDEPAGSRA